MKRQESEEFLQCTPPDLKDTAEAAAQNLLPEKSKDKYEATYNAFINWRKSHKTNSSSQNIVLAYFKELSERKAASSLWSIYSMLKSTILLKEKTDISSYPTLSAFLKKCSVGFEPKKSAVLSCDEVRRFLSEAPDIEYLVTKVALVIGIMGACRSQELTDIKIQDIREEGNLLVITIPKTKTNKPRSFVVNHEFVDVVKKYQALRPATPGTERLFLNYKKGKCSCQVIGKHKIASIPKSIAIYLNLKNPETYTGHCFRRTAATMFANEGGNMIDLKELGGWKSDATAQGYVQDSVYNKAKISNVLSSAVDLPVNNKSVVSTNENLETKRLKMDVSGGLSNFGQISTSKQVLSSKGDMIMNNCVVHIHNYRE